MMPGGLVKEQTKNKHETTDSNLFFHLAFFFLPLERCCVHNAQQPLVTNSRCEANIQLALVCLHCTKPGADRSS